MNRINSPEALRSFTLLYGKEPEVISMQKERYGRALEAFSKAFPDRQEVQLFSAPGRTEIGGNHTDHQHGCALGAAVNCDAIAVVSFHHDGVIRLLSEGYGICEINLSEPEPREDEKGKTAALIRGIAARFLNVGVKLGGFDAYVTSNVLSGSGLSSSAAFETLVAAIVNERYHDSRTDAIGIAKIGQYAENVYFGKNSGLLDQTICSVGGMVFIDFGDVQRPSVSGFSFDFEAAGYALCMTDTKGSHSDLTDDYAAIVEEMHSVARRFGKTYLREVDEKEFYTAIPRLHGKVGDRALLRAIHYFGENRRAIGERETLQNGDLARFFSLFRQSAASSEGLLQNLYSVHQPCAQGIPLALAVSRLILGEDAAVRVHGGGFAGTIQAFVPTEQLAAYRDGMDAVFGAGSCQRLRIRPVGGMRVM